MNRLSIEQQADIAEHLAHGVSVSSTAHLCGRTQKTVLRNLLWIGEACQRFHDKFVIHLKTTRLEADEICCAVSPKADELSEEVIFDQTVRMVYTWIGYDPDAKIVINWHCGGRAYTDAQAFMQDLARRIPGERIQITTDQLVHYRTAVEEAFGSRADYATIRKLMHDPTFTPDLKVRPPKLRENRIASVFGNPDPQFITTTGIECQNTRLRCWNRRLVRSGITFSKSIRHLRAHLALHFCYANFCRIPRTIRCSPAMEAGLTDHVWEIEELIEAINVEAMRMAGS